MEAVVSDLRDERCLSGTSFEVDLKLPSGATIGRLEVDPSWSGQRVKEVAAKFAPNGRSILGILCNEKRLDEFQTVADAGLTSAATLLVILGYRLVPGIYSGGYVALGEEDNTTYRTREKYHTKYNLTVEEDGCFTFERQDCGAHGDYTLGNFSCKGHIAGAGDLVFDDGVALDDEIIARDALLAPPPQWNNTREGLAEFNKAAEDWLNLRDTPPTKSQARLQLGQSKWSVQVTGAVTEWDAKLGEHNIVHTMPLFLSSPSLKVENLDLALAPGVYEGQYVHKEAYTETLYKLHVHDDSSFQIFRYFQTGWGPYGSRERHQEVEFLWNFDAAKLMGTEYTLMDESIEKEFDQFKVNAFKGAHLSLLEGGSISLKVPVGEVGGDPPVHFEKIKLVRGNPE